MIQRRLDSILKWGFFLLALLICTACERSSSRETSPARSKSALAAGKPGAVEANSPSALQRAQDLEEAWANLRWIGAEAAPQGGVAGRLLWFDQRPADDPAAIELFTRFASQATSGQAWIALVSPPVRPDVSLLRPGLCAIDDGAIRRLLAAPDRPSLLRIGDAPLYPIERLELEDLTPRSDQKPGDEAALDPEKTEPPGSGGGLHKAILDWIRRHFGELFALAFALTRLLGAQIETGWYGVLFRFGRADRVLDPGFHPLIPWVWSVRKLRARAMTFDFPAQNVCNAEGLVYRVDTNLVIRISDPIKALIEIRDMSKGCALAVLTSTQAIILQARRDELQSPGLLDERLSNQLRPRLERWGIALEHAGFTSISPAPQSLQILQQETRRDLRAQILRDYRQAGLRLDEGLGLLGRSRTRQQSRVKALPHRRVKIQSREASPQGLRSHRGSAAADHEKN